VLELKRGKKFQEIKDALENNPEDKKIEDKKNLITKVKDTAVELEDKLKDLSKNNYGRIFL
jgi:hypothetical protein